MNPTLNLVYPEKSIITYEINKFPDGQQQVIIKSNYNNFSYLTISSRLNNFKDLELLICVTKSLNNLGIKDISVEIPYCLGSRSDRKFCKGDNNYLKDVICPIINSLNFTSVAVTDPHSDVLEACLNNYNKIPNTELVMWSLTDLYGFKGNLNTGYILISSDAGANKKIYSLAEHILYSGDIITCSKHRDADGKIIKTEVPYFDLSKDVIIVDDICDGGRTFIEIGKTIKERQENFERQTPRETGKVPGKLYLIVTHGIFSKGYDELNRYFDHIYCTNSYKDIPESIWDGDKKQIKTNVSQLNIF